MANRIDILNQLADAAPDLEARQSSQGKAARDALLMKQLGNPQVQTQAQTQDIQAQQQALAGQQRVEQLQRQQKAASDIGSAAVQQMASQGEANLQRAGMAAGERQQTNKELMAARLQNESAESKKRMTQSDIASAQRMQALGHEYDSRLQFATAKQREDLAKLGNGIKEELIDARLAFDKDEMGRKFSNDRQMADFAIASAQSRQEADQKLRALAFAAKQEEMVMNAVRDRIMTIQKQGFIDRQGDLDREMNIKLAQLQASAERQAAEASNKVKNRLAIYQSVGTVAGTVIGAVVGAYVSGGAATSTGAQAGAIAGSQAGGALGAMAANSNI